MQAFIELLLAVAALIAGVAALALVMDVRGRVTTVESGSARLRQLEADVWAAHEAVHRELGELRRDLDASLRELNELKAATQVVPAPPLPKARPGGLDDLRQQLRASHLDPESSTEDL
jgi:hypothetical protein